VWDRGGARGRAQPARTREASGTPPAGHYDPAARSSLDCTGGIRPDRVEEARPEAQNRRDGAPQGERPDRKGRAAPHQRGSNHTTRLAALRPLSRRGVSQPAHRGNACGCVLGECLAPNSGVIPAKAGIQYASVERIGRGYWMPAFACMTLRGLVVGYSVALERRCAAIRNGCTSPCGTNTSSS
jgi:hypothetical protein